MITKIVRHRFVLGIVAGTLLFVGACNNQGPGEGPSSPDAPQIALISPTQDRNIASGTPISITYTLLGDELTSAVAFLDVDEDPSNNNEIVFATDLEAGNNLQVLLTTTSLELGSYTFGVQATNSAGTTVVYARDRNSVAVMLTMNGAPVPGISSPASDREVLAIQTVDLLFNCNDPENEVSWATFYDRNQIVDGNEVFIPNGAGTGNSPIGSANQQVTWAPIGVPQGTYFVGLTCIDTAESAVTTYSNARISVVSEITIPSATITAPSTDRVVTLDDEVVVQFSISDPSSTEARVNVYVDTNDRFEFDTTEVVLAQGLPASTTSFTIDSSIVAALPEDTYFVVVTVEQNNQRSVSYAGGRLRIVGTGALSVTSPPKGVVTAIRPGTDVQVIWLTNLSVGEGVIDLATFNADADGQPTTPLVPDPLENAKDLPVAPNSFSMDTSSLEGGSYVVEVTQTRVDADGQQTGETARDVSGVIRVTTQPNIFWVGAIEVPDGEENPPGHVDGIVFEGVNFEDNAGSSFQALGELPIGQGIETAFLVGAQYAKPLLANPNGIGAGQAYLMYNDLPLINQRYSLNAVGARDTPEDVDGDGLLGLQISGIAFDPASEEVLSPGNTPSLDILSEDADGDGRLDLVDEDLDGDGVLDAIEDVDQDGHLDFVEDGWVGVDDNGDGVIDNASARCYVAQYENGALETAINEDRDFDGKLDEQGDATWGLSSIGLVPDVDGDGVPELAFGFQFTDSMTADFRRTLLGVFEVPGFGELSQENHFERGGFVIVPSSDESTILDPFAPGASFEGRVLELDRVGQFFSTEQEPDNGPPDDVTGIQPPNSQLTRAATNGHDVVPFGRSILGGDPGQSLVCPTGTVQVLFFNNISLGNQARARWRIFETVDDGPDQEIEAAFTIEAAPGAIAARCVAVADGQSLRFVPIEVQIVNDSNQVVGGAIDQREVIAGLPAGGQIVAGVVGSLGDLVLGGGQPMAMNLDDIPAGNTENCVIGGAGGCLETLAGPFYGFDNFGDLGGFFDDNVTVDSPSHPLAYRRTLANPLRAAGAGERCVPADTATEGEKLRGEFGLANVGCTNCGRVLTNLSTIVDATAPAVFTPGLLSTGYYPGTPGPPHGARLLGQRVGDRFGAAISRSQGTDDRVFMGAPMRDVDDREAAGLVYQFRMESMWDSRGTLAYLNDDDVPKPHQYIIKEVGSSRPDSNEGRVRLALRDAIEYSGADSGDRLGSAIIGIPDFNGDARDDILMGASGADGALDDRPDSGAVYAIYRIPVPIEASVSLDKIELGPSDPNRLNGMLINGDYNDTDGGDAIGEVLAGVCDLNDDGRGDFVIGSPLHGPTNAGEVVVVFGGENLPSPENGFSIQDVVDRGRAIRIQGLAAGDQAGFNVACGGDFDGDGVDDLVLSAPFATPMYDSNGDDVPDSPGLDLDRDGLNDGIIPDATEAGIIYVITNVGAQTGTINLDEMGALLQGHIIVGAQAGYQLGGGFDPKRQVPSRGLAYGGDINGDGKDDLLVGSILADPSGKTNAGEAYLIFGFDAVEAEDMLAGN